jgi:hypothetical protein
MSCGNRQYDARAILCENLREGLHTYVAALQRDAGRFGSEGRMVREPLRREGSPPRWIGQVHRCLIHAEILAFVAPSDRKSFWGVLPSSPTPLCPGPSNEPILRFKGPAPFTARKSRLQSTAQAQYYH